MTGDEAKRRGIATAQNALSKIGTAVNSRHACVVLIAMLLTALRRFHNVSEAQALLEARAYAATVDAANQPATRKVA